MTQNQYQPPRLMGVYAEHVLPQLDDDSDDLVDYMEEQRMGENADGQPLAELFGRTLATPERLGLTFDDWDFPDPAAATWVTREGTPWTLGGMTDSHLANTFRYLERRHGGEFLRRTPLGRAMLAVLATRGVSL